MDHISQFIVDLSWGLTFGALIAVGTLAAQAAGGIAIALVTTGLGWALWRKLRRRG